MTSEGITFVLFFYCIIQFGPWYSKLSHNLLVIYLLLSVSLGVLFSVISISMQWAKNRRRAQTVTLHGEGYTERDIAAKLRCSKSAVHNAIVTFNADGSFYDRERSGHPRKTKTPKEDCLMSQVVMRAPKSSCNTIRSILRLIDTAISSRTVSRCLSKKFELKSHKPARKPHLTLWRHNYILSISRMYSNLFDLERMVSLILLSI